MIYDTRAAQAFDQGYEDCCDKLWIMSFLCEIVDWVSNVCHIARIGELLCVIAGAVKSLVVSAVSACQPWDGAHTNTSQTHTHTHTEAYTYKHT